MKKRTFPNFEKRKGMKKSILKSLKRESEAFILWNRREREFLLTPEYAHAIFYAFCVSAFKQVGLLL